MGDVIDIGQGDIAKRDKAKKTRVIKPQTKLTHPNLSPTYNEQLAIRICELIAEGMSYPAIQKVHKDAPTWFTLTKWRAERKDFDRLYRAARIAQAEKFVDQIIDIADESRDAAMAAVRIKSRQWLAAKRLPQVYGDAVRLEIEETATSDMTPFEIARRLAFALSQDKTPIIDNMSQANQPKVSPNTGSIPDNGENAPENRSNVLTPYERDDNAGPE